MSQSFVCPKNKTALRPESNSWVADDGQRYPIVRNIPVFLLEDIPQTMELAKRSIAYAKGSIKDEIPEIYVESLGISSEEKKALLRTLRDKTSAVDPVASYLIGATNGIAYSQCVGRLRSYPIPELDLSLPKGALILDIGCNWGRWSIAAARKGYRPIGIDPSLGAVAAAGRICRELDISAEFVCGDGRFLPFKDETFDGVFSYSVLQHLEPENVRMTVQEIHRVLKPGGKALIQMPNRCGVRSLTHQMKRGFRKAKDFEVRYWGLEELERLFSDRIGPTRFFVDCYFGLGLQSSDSPLMSFPKRLVIRCSELLKGLSRQCGWLVRIADSVYFEAVKPAK